MTTSSHELAPRDEGSRVSARPEPTAPRPYHFPKFEKRVLPNGLRLVIAPVHKLPVVSIVAVCAVSVRRGSTTISVPPAARCAWKYCISGGIVSAGVLPTSRMTSALAMSATGKGSPRSMPAARIAAPAALDMQNRPL